jgi:hypothetical protein
VRNGIELIDLNKKEREREAREIKQNTQTLLPELSRVSFNFSLKEREREAREIWRNTRNLLPELSRVSLYFACFAFPFFLLRSVNSMPSVARGIG